MMGSAGPRSPRERRFDDATVCSTRRLLAEGWEWMGGEGRMAQAAGGTLSQVARVTTPFPPPTTKKIKTKNHQNMKKTESKSKK